MQFSLAVIATLAASVAASPRPQGVTENIKPDAASPPGCSGSYDGTFNIAVVNATTSSKKRSIDDLEKRQLAGILTLTLKDGILIDQAGRTGYIAANYQFQFDKPAQTGAIYTAGFSACSNNTLALGGSNVFYQCLSGDFYNLYDRHWAPQCSPIYFYIQKPGSGNGAGQAPDGQPGATTVVSVKSDGQPVPTVMPVSQIADGQPQGHSQLPPVTQIPDGQPQAPPAGQPISQISDGQPQAPTGAPNATIPMVPPTTYAGAAATAAYQVGAAAAAGLIGLAALL